MSRITPVVEELFELIRGRFPTVVMGNASAETTIDPADARFFNFDFIVDDENHGNVTVSILDEKSVKLIFSRNITQDLSFAHKQAWFDFLGEIRQFTSENLLGFDARDITKPNVDQQDIDYLKKADANYDYDEIDVTESFNVAKSGTSKSSYHKLESAKIIVRHTKRVNEESVGSRSRNISALFVETQAGERFKLPHKNMPAARAVAYRINSGGTWNDSVCTSINEVATQAHTLTEFLKRARKLQTESQQTQRVLKMAKTKRNKYKKLLDSLATKRGWDQFVSEHATAVEPDSTDLFGQVGKIMKEYEENIMASAGKMTQVLESETWEGVSVSIPGAGMFESNQAMVEYILKTAAASVSSENASAIREFATHVVENYAVLDAATRQSAVAVCKHVLEACKSRVAAKETVGRSIDAELLGEFAESMNDVIDEAPGDTIGRKFNKALYWDKKFSTPGSVVANVRKMSTDELQSLSSSESAGDGSPRSLQLKAIAQELRRRGVAPMQEAPEEIWHDNIEEFGEFGEDTFAQDEEFGDDTFMHEESVESDTFVHVQLELTSNRTHTGGAASFADEFGVEHASSYTKNGRVVHVFVGDAHVAGLMSEEPGVVSAELSSSVDSVVPPITEAPMDPLGDAGIPVIW